MWSFEITQILKYEIATEPASGSTKCSWNCSLNSENISAANLHGSGDLASHFNFSQNRKFRKQLDLTCDSNVNSQNDFTKAQLLHISSVVTVILG